MFYFPRSLGNLACSCGRDEVVDASECSVSFFNCIIDPCIRGTDVVPPNFPDVFSDVETQFDILQLRSDLFELGAITITFSKFRYPTM